MTAAGRRPGENATREQIPGRGQESVRGERLQPDHGSLDRGGCRGERGDGALLLRQQGAGICRRATAVRVLSQLRHHPRAIGMLVVVPALLLILPRYVLNSRQAFDRTAPMLLGLFPFVVMFLVTSVATLRERRTGTLGRLMTMPMAKLDFLIGYGIAFGAIAIVQVAVVATITLTWLGLTIAGGIWILALATVLSALLGTTLGLAVSAFAKSEFQAVQFMPVFELPQALLCGLFVPR